MKRLLAFKYALQGVLKALQAEFHLKVHFFATFLLTGAGFYFNVSSLEWAVLLICIGVVISLEMMNSAIEKLSDKVDSTVSEKIAYVKDVAAGAVLVFSLISTAVAVIIFTPYIIKQVF
ncbi:MAG: diacylglycerol kinase family protein [Flavobacteriales bacterium]